MRLDPARFADPAVVVARIFGNARFPERMTVSECAERYRKLDNTGGGRSGLWSFAAAPYLRRPMDCLAVDSTYSTVAVMGPSQCGKSEIGNNWLLHTVICDPADMLFCLPDKAIMEEYSRTVLSRMIASCPELRAKMLPTIGADNIMSKDFYGCHLANIWPVKAQFRARPVPRIRLDDYDAIPENIDGEGDPLTLTRGRQITFAGFEKTYVNSSPARGTTRGIEAVVAVGTDERWFVACQHCGDYFELSYERLQFDDRHDPAAAADSAVVVCPDCGGVHGQEHKPAMMARGDWVGAGQTIAADGTVSGDLRQTETASFRFTGLMGFDPWRNLARDHRAAAIEFRNTQDEHAIRAFFNTRAGVNYASKVDGEGPLEPKILKDRVDAADYCKGHVPPGVVVLVASIDVQGNRFAVQITGFGSGMETFLIDRFDILAIDGGTTPVRPHLHASHWSVLLDKVIWRRWPLRDNPRGCMKIFSAAIDTGGLEGVTENAFAFWHAAIKLGVGPNVLTLVKGGNKPDAPILPQPKIDAKRQVRGAPQVELFVPNVHRLKDRLNVRLRNRTRGPAYVHFPRDFDHSHVDELTAETKENGVWTRKPGQPNETLDLTVYAEVPVLRFSGGDSSLSWVPAWARPRVDLAPTPVDRTGLGDGVSLPASAGPDGGAESPPAAPPPADDDAGAAADMGAGAAPTEAELAAAAAAPPPAAGRARKRSHIRVTRAR